MVMPLGRVFTRLFQGPIRTAELAIRFSHLPQVAAGKIPFDP
jgi:hypothetical protein